MIATELAMITCRELTEFLDDYVSGALPPERRAVFDSHMSGCPDCRNYLASYRATVRLVKGAADATPADVPPGLIRAVMAARASGGRDARAS